MYSILEIKRFIKKWSFLIALYLGTFFVLVFAAHNLNNSQLKVGDVSPKTYKATRDVENEVATKRNQELAKAEVQTVYVVYEKKNQ